MRRFADHTITGAGAGQMAQTDEGTDPALFEYFLFSASTVDALSLVAHAVVELVQAHQILLVDAVVLERLPGQVEVRSAAPATFEVLSPLGVHTSGTAALSAHDVSLASLALAPDETALLILVEDLWAQPLAEASRARGVRLISGGRIAGR